LDALQNIESMKQVNRVEITVKDIIKELININEADIYDYLTIVKKEKKTYSMTQNGQPAELVTSYYEIEYKDLATLTKDQRKRIKAIEQTSIGIKITLYDKQKALDSLYEIIAVSDTYSGVDTGAFAQLSIEELEAMYKTLEEVDNVDAKQ